MTHLSNMIKELRIEHNLSQAALAKELGVSQSAVYYWENGKREPSIDMLEKIANYFGISKKLFLSSAWEDYGILATGEQAMFGKSRSFTEYLQSLSYFTEQKEAEIFPEEDWQLDIIVGKAMQLSDEGRYKVIEYLDDLILSGKYNRDKEKKKKD